MPRTSRSGDDPSLVLGPDGRRREPSGDAPEMPRVVTTWPAWTLTPVDQLNLDLFDEDGNLIFDEPQHEHGRDIA
jgi:hypothetical protein